MTKASIYYDTRRANKDGSFPLRIMISKNRKRASVVLGINLLPEQWVNGTVVKHKDAKLLNTVISDKLTQVNKAIIQLNLTGKLAGKTAKEALSLIQETIDPEVAEKKAEEERLKQAELNNLAGFFQEFIGTKDKEGTKKLYQDTFNKLGAFCAASGRDFSEITFDDVTPQFLRDFEQFCLTTQKQNTAARHLRDIRAVMNAAIDEERTRNYPFRKFKIKHEQSRDKSYSAKELRDLFTFNCYPGGEQEAVDIFKLMFCLIGINNLDLVNLTEIKRGRIEYPRSKTDKPYSIKVEPEALEIIMKYKGETHLLNILERVPNYKTYYNRLGKTLRKVGLTRVDGKTSTGKAILPDVCFSAARTSWATIAQAELGIDRETIAAALGHHTVDVTTTYLRTDWRKKVDEANRKVLDWVFYEERKKRTRS